ncbi:unnamed protein product [Closterium sp. Naga37s-1]|nr:unnamed protein product [Closterium sp. Naga37s-1]
MERASGRRLACKVVAARKQAMDAAGREVVALSLLKECENIVTLEDVFIGEEGKGMVLVMELATGGDLLTRIEQKGRIPEHEAPRNLIRSMLATDPQIRPSIDEVLNDPWVCNSSFLPSSFSISASSGGFVKSAASAVPPAASAVPPAPAGTANPAAAFTIKPAPSVVTPAAPAKTRPPATCDPSSTFIFPLATLTIKTTYKTTCSTVKSCRKLASDVLQRKQWRRHGAVTSKLSPCASKLSPCNSSLSRRHSSRSQRSSFSAASGRLSARVADMAVAAAGEATAGGTFDATAVQWSF